MREVSDEGALHGIGSGGKRDGIEAVLVRGYARVQGTAHVHAGTDERFAREAVRNGTAQGEPFGVLSQLRRYFVAVWK